MDYLYSFYKFCTSYSRVCKNCNVSFYSDLNDADYCSDGCALSSLNSAEVTVAVDVTSSSLSDSVNGSDIFDS